MIKSIQESSEASIRGLPEGELPVFAATDERVVEMHGEALKVFKAVEAALGHLRKFLIDHSVLPLFERPVTKDRQSSGTWSDQSLLQSIQSSNSFSSNRELLFIDRESRLESQLASTGVTLFGLDPALSSIRSGRIGHVDAPIVTREFINGQQGQLQTSYGKVDSGDRSAYPQLGDVSYA